MEFAGKTLEDQSAQNGSNLANRLVNAESLPTDQYNEEIHRTRLEIKSAIENDHDTIASFALITA